MDEADEDLFTGRVRVQTVRPERVRASKAYVEAYALLCPRKQRGLHFLQAGRWYEDIDMCPCRPPDLDGSAGPVANSDGRFSACSIPSETGREFRLCTACSLSAGHRYCSLSSTRSDTAKVASLYNLDHMHYVPPIQR
jgi:hypothetical protein